jgi:hypothetical protein
MSGDGEGGEALSSAWLAIADCTQEGLLALQTAGRPVTVMGQYVMWVLVGEEGEGEKGLGRLGVVCRIVAIDNLGARCQLAGPDGATVVIRTELSGAVMCSTGAILRVTGDVSAFRRSLRVATSSLSPEYMITCKVRVQVVGGGGEGGELCISARIVREEVGVDVRRWEEMLRLVAAAKS